MDDGSPFAEEQGQAAGTGMELAVPVTQDSGTTPEKGKRKRTVTAARLAAKTAKRNPVPADVHEEGHNAKEPDQHPKVGAAAERFGTYHKKGTGWYWDIPEEAEDEEVLEEALRPHRGKQAYLAMLNNDNHVSVIHSLCRLKTELRPKNPVKGKIAAFVGEVRPGGNTPNLVVFDEESEIFASNLYPKVRFSLVTQYHAEGQKYLPKADNMSDDPNDADDVRQLRRIMPIPTHWVPIFMDGPSADVAIGRLTALVQQAEQEQLDDYAPFIYMLTTASCALQEDTNVSIMAIEASKLNYRVGLLWQIRMTREGSRGRNQCFFPVHIF